MICSVDASSKGDSSRHKPLQETSLPSRLCSASMLACCKFHDFFERRLARLLHNVLQASIVPLVHSY